MISKLFKENRSLLGNEKSFKILEQYLPLKYYKIPSGTKCFDWPVPKKWVLKKAILKDLSGNIIIDASKNILQVINYSNSFQGKISKEDLNNKLHVDKGISSIPYRTAYYSGKWGFCLSEEQYSQLNDKEYIVDIQSKFVDSEMILGECLIKGESEKEIILSSYLCHPNQINDGLSGVQLLVNLYHLLKQNKNKYTYRLFFISETIGSIALLSQKIIKPKNVEFAMVATCVGIGEDLHYKKTHLGNHTIDNIIIDNFPVFQHEFKPWGSDERQFSSPKIRIPTCSLMRTRWQDFVNYHTSNDDYVSIELINKTSEVYFQILKLYETEKRYIINHEGGEPFLQQHQLYRTIGKPGHSDIGKIINWIIFLSDGKNTISDIVIKSGFNRYEIEYFINILIEKGVI